MNKSIPLLLALGLLSLAAAASDFTALDRERARQLVDPAAHTRPTIVALWSSECVHCKKNLKLFAALGRKHPQLNLVSVATEPASPGLAAHLSALPSTASRYAYGTHSPEALAFALDPDWHGELPRTLIFNGRGGRIARSGVLDEASLRRDLGLTGR